MSSITTNTNSRIERNMRNHSNQFIGGKDSHFAIKQARTAQKRGKSDERKRAVSKLRNSRDIRQSSILEGQSPVPFWQSSGWGDYSFVYFYDNSDGWSEEHRNFIAESRNDSSFCTFAQANAKTEFITRRRRDNIVNYRRWDTNYKKTSYGGWRSFFMW